MYKLDDLKIAVLGLGYVGLPLAIEFAKKRPVLGFDVSKRRVQEINRKHMETIDGLADGDIMPTGLTVTYSSEDLADCNCYIVCVPTPVDEAHNPDLSNLIKASELVGSHLNDGDIVIFESTVYPGVTEEICAPILSTTSQLEYADSYCKSSDKIFHVGYSPERVSPGLGAKSLPEIIKVTSGSTKKVADLIDELYGSIITAGTFKAANIKTAEAAKIIENTQRDVNIALVNEFSLIFKALELDTSAVLAAAATKWNFQLYTPGLVGGHCIGVDPYYLAHKAKLMGIHPQLILAGRKINEEMSKIVAEEVVKLSLKKGINLIESKAIILGCTFKENCPDTRNSKVFDLYRELGAYQIDAVIFDPVADLDGSVSINEGTVLREITTEKFDIAILAVPHEEIVSNGLHWIKNLLKPTSVFFDLKSHFDLLDADGRL